MSLVRTREVGHSLRAIRRWIVALSRAKLGLYVFGRLEVFSGQYELHPMMHLFAKRPHQLELVPGERSGKSKRKVDAKVKPSEIKSIQDVTEMGQLVYEWAQERVSSGMIE